MKIFVVAEREQLIKELCGGAREFAQEVALVALEGAEVPSCVADVVYRLSVPEGCMSEDVASSLTQLIKEEQPEAVFVGTSKRVQLLIGRVAAQLKTSAIANVMEMPSESEALTMYFGGLANRRIRKKQGVGIFFVRPATFPDAEPSGENKEIPVDFIAPAYQVTKTGTSPRVKGDVDLPSAKRIVSVGRGVKKEEDLAMIRELCSLIGAELGCSRSIYETESWLPKEALVGISGCTVTPDLYFTVGISGQAQHMVACDSSGTIMCVNNDPHALIFEHSDYGSKGDLYVVIPRLIDYLKEHPLK